MKNITEDSIMNLMQLSIHTALADNVIHNDEKESINKFCTTFGIDLILPNEEFDLSLFNKDKLIPLEKIISTFKSPNEKYLGLNTVIDIVSSDGEYSSEEYKFVESFCSKIGLLDETLIQKINLLVEQMCQLRNMKISLQKEIITNLGG